MGRAVLDVLLQRGHSLACAFDSSSSAYYGKDAGALVSDKLGVIVSPVNDDVEKCSCVIDFSSPDASMELLAAAVRHKTPVVIGTTGFSDEQKTEIEKASKVIPLVFSPNMAVGVNLLFKLTETAAAVLGDDFDVEILEIHHRLKKDAPSGTAKRLADIVKEHMNGMAGARAVTGRNGLTGERESAEIGIMALRGGDAVGEHTVYFIGEGERIELTIRSTKRDTDAKGAVVAAEVLNGRPAGFYSMYDVLGL
jgi:4-hydroxy-tetrahydrodipicolinate reductase